MKKKKIWTLKSAKEDYSSRRYTKKCANCEFATGYPSCLVSGKDAYGDGTLMALFCKYYTKREGK